VAGENKRKRNVIDDPVREREKLDALLGLEEKVDPFKPIKEVIADIYDILAALFKITRLGILMGGSGHYTLYEKKADALEVEKREIESEEEAGGGKLNSYVIHESYTISAFLAMEPDRYSLQKDARFFAMVGNIISEKVLLASFHMAQKE